VSKAVYSGRTRLWQGDAVIEAERMELERTTQGLEAIGKVRGVFPEAAIDEKARQEKIKDDAETLRAQRGAEKAGVVKFTAGRLAYSGAEGKARLEEAVTLESSTARLAAREIILTFTPTGGVQRVSSAEGLGGCTIRQGERRGAAERCRYDAAEGKFILMGGEPSLSDPVLGVTTGRQLTFFLADDRILVESAEGTRTVTRHRVEK
jgi:lipopolysaccharide export system protein LptA